MGKQAFLPQHLDKTASNEQIGQTRREELRQKTSVRNDEKMGKFNRWVQHSNTQSVMYSM